MKPLPDKIKVGGLTYTIIVDNDPSMMIDANALGFHNAHKLTISISNVHPLKQRETLFHELIHAIGHNLGLGLEEYQVCGLEHGLFSLFQDNDLICFSEKYEEEVHP